MHPRVQLRGSLSPPAILLHAPPQPPPARISADGFVVLPVFDPHSFAARKETRRLQEAEKRIHLLPLVVLLCFLMLWWFCYPVTLEMVGGRVVAIYRLDASILEDGSSR